MGFEKALKALMIGVKATGQWSFKQDITGFFTISMLAEVLKQVGTIFLLREI